MKDTAEARMGRLLPDGGVEFVRHLAHAPEKVWRALTESEHLVHWFPTDILGERRAGASLELPFWPRVVERWSIEQPVTKGELVAWVPPRLFEWTWEGDRLRWQLEPEAQGTRLVLSTWFADATAEYRTKSESGYHLCLDQLEELLDTGSVSYLEDATIAEFEKKYADLA
ncbi:MAG TPA: SRPBCC domain-containing protein [Nocardioides sp.]|uniref:SRPBCC domain-containing protein n=1 Tax=Nocardioides sp. TaxID=35761 RepID=UPI002D7E7B1E|nr:SRPBCC domain-containing protein [Nocardioides sp.]HET6654184.1 SRPBCC domain-containing protein [Nocardioides sp.]